jgi:hypothetical protein
MGPDMENALIYQEMVHNKEMLSELEEVSIETVLTEMQSERNNTKNRTS